MSLDPDTLNIIITIVLSIAGATAAAILWITRAIKAAGSEGINKARVEAELKRIKELEAQLRIVEQQLERTCGELADTVLKVKVWWKFVEEEIPSSLLRLRHNHIPE